jgi:hypothetical protein
MNERFEENGAGPATMEVDRLLREFYHDEMPHPWPRLNLPVPSSGRLASRYTRYFTRFALAASIVLALVAYWAVAGLVAEPGSSTTIHGREIGNKPAHLKDMLPLERQRTPAGNDAQLFEESTPNGGIVINIIGPSTSKGPR